VAVIIGRRELRGAAFRRRLPRVGAIEIGEATEEERLWSARLMAASEPWITLGRGYEACRALAVDPAYLTLVARRDGAPCGFIRLHPRGVAGSPYVASVAVAETERGHGVGTALLDAAERRYPGVRYIFLCVSSFNPRARALYERHGYRLIGELLDYVIDGASEFLMAKRLG
jgi:ribosomal-protein-alanine N-acetyltransferase